MPLRTSTKRKAESSLINPRQKKVQAEKEQQELIYDQDGTSECSDTSPEQSVKNNASSTSTPLTAASPDPTKWRPFIYKCKWKDCGKVFNRPCRLEDHMNAHTNTRPHVCDRPGCDKSFLRDTHLRRHILQVHSTDKNYACTWRGCDKKFATGTRLKRHVATHEGHKYRCTGYPPCDEYFRKHSTLQAHINAVHLNKKAYQCTLIDEETGKQCSAAYDTSTRLDSHILRTHSGHRYFCSICSGQSPDEQETLPGQTEDDSMGMIGFATFVALEEHMKQAHPPTCLECLETFETNSDLKDHIRASKTHQKPKPEARNKCDEPGCERSFTTKHNLTMHIRRAHNLLKPFVCGEHNLSDSLREGVAEWDGTDKCGGGFNSKQELEVHVQRHHLTERPLKTVSEKTKMKWAAEARLPTISRITGVQTRDANTGLILQCLLPTCPYQAPPGDYGTKLHRHLQDAHGLADQEIEDALIEREALSGGQFWVGGIDPRESRWMQEDDEENRALDLQCGLVANHSDRIDVRGGIVVPGSSANTVVSMGLVDPLLLCGDESITLQAGCEQALVNQEPGQDEPHDLNAVVEFLNEAN